MGFDKTKIEFSALLRAQTGLIFFRSPEEERGRAILREVAKLTELPLFFWTPSQGLKNELGDAPVYSTVKIFSALDHIAVSDKPAIYVMCDMDTIIPDIVVQSRLKEMSRKFKDMPGGIVIMCGHDIVPNSLRSYSSTVEAEPPSEKEYEALISNVLLRLSARMPVVDALDNKGYRRMVAALKGLSLFQAEQVITRAVIDDGKLSADDIVQAMAAKKRIIQEQGLLEYYSSAESLADVAGLDGLKGWLAKRKKIFAEPAKAKSFGLPFPKGVLIIGVQGCGKSLCAKAVANEWGLPLLRLDPALLFDKYIGASERNLTAALAAAEKMAPAVLWIDEIEKAFSSVPGDDGGTSMRVLGGFLTWLSDRKGDVFAVATANDISALPPELTRKGRFDEIFFVDLPDETDRARLFALHLKKRGKDPEKYFCETLAKHSAGFSGAEIEQAVVAAMYTAFSQEKDLTPQHVYDELCGTVPLSVTLREKVDGLRSWAKGRAVRA